MKTVLVLGNARSGTSMTAGILHYLGVHLNHVNEPSAQNPHGGFENVTVNVITTKLYQASLGIKFTEKKDELLESFRKYVKTHKKDLWGWKSALTHWNLDLFLREVENPHLIIVTRNLYHNAMSWKKHMKEVYNQEVSTEFALEEMSVSQSALIKNTYDQTCPKMWTTHEDLKTKPLQETEKIADFLNIELDEQKLQKISEFILPHYTTIGETHG